VPEAVLCADRSSGPLVHTATAAAVAAALPGWQLRPAPSSPARLAAAVLRADALVIAGGALGHDHGRELRLAADLVRLRDRPLALLDVRAPAGRSRRARALVRRADLLVVRGRWTAARLAAGGAPAPFRVASSLLWATAGAQAGQWQPSSAPRALLAVPRAPFTAGSLAPGLRDASEQLGLPLQVASWGTPRDHEIARALVARVPDSRLLAVPGDPATAVSQAAAAGVVLATTTADVVFAAAGGARAAVLTGNPDLTRLALSAQQPTVGPTAGATRLRDALRTAAAADPFPVAEAQQAIAAARASLALLRLVCERGEGVDPVDLLSLPLEPAPGAEA
jgi:hypothetical protein